MVAHRTSPTNIGLLLTSTLAAYDLGYTGQLDLITRLQATFDTLDQLEHYRGHLLNWYDTESLAALAPRYVSTVDSGNLAGCLLVIEQACLAFPEFVRDSPAALARLARYARSSGRKPRRALQHPPGRIGWLICAPIWLSLRQTIQAILQAPDQWACV